MTSVRHVCRHKKWMCASISAKTLKQHYEKRDRLRRIMPYMWVFPSMIVLSIVFPITNMILFSDFAN